MAVYEVFRFDEVASDPYTKWHYFEDDGHYLGRYSYQSGKGGPGNYYILQGAIPLDPQFIGICESNKSFVFYNAGKYACLHYDQMTELLWPSHIKPSFTQVLHAWTAGSLGTSALKIVMNRVFNTSTLEEPNKPSAPKYAWTLSAKGVEHAV